MSVSYSSLTNSKAERLKPWSMTAITIIVLRLGSASFSKIRLYAGKSGVSKTTMV